MKTKIQNLLVTLVVFAGIHNAIAQGTTAFTYQGQLRDGGTNANGTYTMTFKLYDAVSGGGQIGSTLTTSPTLANGLFTVNLDFGSGAFNGAARWLDITVQAGLNTPETLSPRVQVLPTPYAQFAAVAATVTNGAIQNAQLGGNAVNTTNIQNNAVTAAQLANGAVTNRNLTANAVNATNIASGQVVKGLNGLTDSVKLAAGANMALFTNGNALQISASVPNIQVFTTSGTFVVPTNVTRIMVEMWGGGGGGGSGFNNQTNIPHSGGGGGAGAYAWNVFSVTPGASYLVTAGSAGSGGYYISGGILFYASPGGNSSLGALLSAAGGSGGGSGTVSSEGGGGLGGQTTSGSLANVQGGNGRPGGESFSGGGDGGGVWRGGSGGQHPSGVGEGGPGGDGATPHSGYDGQFGVVIVYY